MTYITRRRNSDLRAQCEPGGRGGKDGQPTRLRAMWYTPQRRRGGSTDTTAQLVAARKFFHPPSPPYTIDRPKEPMGKGKKGKEGKIRDGSEGWDKRNEEEGGGEKRHWERSEFAVDCTVRTVCDMQWIYNAVETFFYGL